MSCHSGLTDWIRFDIRHSTRLHRTGWNGMRPLHSMDRMGLAGLGWTDPVATCDLRLTTWDWALRTGTMLGAWKLGYLRYTNVDVHTHPLSLSFSPFLGHSHLSHLHIHQGYTSAEKPFQIRATVTVRSERARVRMSIHGSHTKGERGGRVTRGSHWTRGARVRKASERMESRHKSPLTVTTNIKNIPNININPNTTGIPWEWGLGERWRSRNRKREEQESWHAEDTWQPDGFRLIEWYHAMVN